jgi:hypothetical protein
MSLKITMPKFFLFTYYVIAKSEEERLCKIKYMDREYQPHRKGNKKTKRASGWQKLITSLYKSNLSVSE